MGTQTTDQARSAPTIEPVHSVGETAPLRILLVEDNDVNQELALLLLEQLGYAADVAGNGLEALALLDARSYDVVLMDVQMPGMDGLEATRRINAQWPAAQRPRIIALTANALASDRDACLAAGMDDYIAKPIRIERLAAALARCTTVEADRSRGLVLDRGVIDRLRVGVAGENTDTMRRLITLFLDDTPKKLVLLRQGIEEDDPEATYHAAHTLKSSAAMFGAQRLSNLCQELEAMGKAKRLDGADDVLIHVEAEYTLVSSELITIHDEQSQ